MVSKRFWLVVLTFVVVILLLIPVGFICTPTYSQVVRIALGSDRVILDAHGNPLQTLRVDFQKRRLSWFPISAFPKNLKEVIVTTEDRRFYSHFGIDFWGAMRAVWALVSGRRIQGASTISMQVSDLIQERVLLNNEPIRKGSLPLKILQMARALMLELKWSKEQILEAYLNLIHLKGELQGVPALSFAHLGKHPTALDETESAVIAAQIASPNQKKSDLAQRACRIANRNPGKTLDCAAINITTEKFFSKNRRLPAAWGMAPHLARRLIQDHPQLPVISTSIDPKLQRETLEILRRNLGRLSGKNVRDSAAIVIHNRTGKVLAYVGAVPESENHHVDGVISSRQAGSTLKPFLYGRAFDNKTLTPASILLDEATAITWEGGVYRPTNYDRTFYGPVSAREALGSSLNVPAVKVVTIIGLHSAYQTLEAVGLTGLKEPDFYGVSMALGAVEVRLDELTNAYRMLANNGMWTPLKLHIDIEDSSDPEAVRRVFPDNVTFLLSSILSEPNSRVLGFGWETPLETPFWTAVKTGTSKDYRDNWCIGFSSEYTVGVWAGNFTAEAMRKVSGVAGAGPSWYEIMSYLHRSTKSHPPTRPQHMVTQKVKHPWKSRAYHEYFIEGTQPATTLIGLAQDQRVQFVFPAEGSTLIKDPHLDPEAIALFVRFRGNVPPGSRMFLNGREIGVAESPFKMATIDNGRSVLSIRDPNGKTMAEVNFQIRGGTNEPSTR